MAEWVSRARPLGPRLTVRVDLHGVSLFGPGEQRTLIRWEWMTDITAGDGVVVRGSNAEITLPARAFGMEPAALAERLEAARSIVSRPEVIGELASR